MGEIGPEEAIRLILRNMDFELESAEYKGFMTAIGIDFLCFYVKIVGEDSSKLVTFLPPQDELDNINPGFFSRELVSKNLNEEDAKDFLFKYYIGSYFVEKEMVELENSINESKHAVKH